MRGGKKRMRVIESREWDTGEGRVERKEESKRKDE